MISYILPYTEDIQNNTCRARIHWVNPQPRRKYIALVASADVVLEPWPVGGGVSR